MEIINKSKFTVFIIFTWLILLVHLVKSSSWLSSDEFLEVSPDEEESCDLGARYKRDILGIFSNKRHKKRSADLAAKIHQDPVTPPPPFQQATNLPLPWQGNDASIPPENLNPDINVKKRDEVTPVGNIVRFTNQPELLAPSRFPVTTPSPIAMANKNFRLNDDDALDADIPIV